MANCQLLNINYVFDNHNSYHKFRSFCIYKISGTFIK